MTFENFDSPGTWAKRLKMGEAKIIAAMDAGELEAHNMASPGSRRPRYRIRQAAIEQWLRSRSTVANRAPEPAPRSRRRSASDVPSYV